MFASKLFKRGSKKTEEPPPEDAPEDEPGDDESAEPLTGELDPDNPIHPDGGDPADLEGRHPADDMSDEEPAMEDKDMGGDDERDDERHGQEDDDDDEDVQSARIEGAYDPADYEHLQVAPEVGQLFQFITSYTPQTVELENRLRPFIPDFIPAIGDIDAFIKVERPDAKADSIGLSVLDEPRAQQSDKNVLDLQLRAVAKTTTAKQATVASVSNADRNHKAVEKWIKDIGDLHRSKPAPSVHYNKPMPEIDFLMQEWPSEFEDVLSSANLPTADLDCDLATYVEIICSIMDIPVYKSKVQSLHVLFTLYSAFKQSGHFGQQPEAAGPGYNQMAM